MKRSFDDMSQAVSSSSQMVVDGNYTGSGKYSARKPSRLGVKSRRGGKRLTARQSRQVKTLISRRSELKYFVVNQAALNITNAAAIAQISGVPQGSTDSERDGDRLMWCGTWEFNYQCINGTGATGDVYDNTRVVIFQWHPSSALGGPIPTGIFIVGPSTNVDIYSTYNHDYRQMYTILYDSDNFTAGSGASASYPATSLAATGVKRVRINTAGIAKQVQYNAGSINGTNQIYILYVSDSTLATHPTLLYQWKLFFRDS